MNPVRVMVPDDLPEEDTADMAAARAMEEIAQVSVGKHMGPDDHPSGSSQLVHGGGSNARKDKIKFWVDVLRFRRNRDGTFGTASYGPYSTRELAEAAIARMNTKRFKAVVGERAERDLDRAFSPRDYNALTNDIGRRSLTVYHGTKSEARLAGDFSTAPKDGPYILFGPGYYFTLEEGRAAAYGSSMTVKLDNVRLYETPLYDDYRMGDVAARAGVLDRLKQKKLDATADNIIAEFQSMGYDGFLLGEKENYSRWPEQVVIWDHRLINIAKHYGPGAHPSGSEQTAHAGSPQGHRRDLVGVLTSKMPDWISKSGSLPHVGIERLTRPQLQELVLGDIPPTGYPMIIYGAHRHVKRLTNDERMKQHKDIATSTAVDFDKPLAQRRFGDHLVTYKDRYKGDSALLIDGEIMDRAYKAIEVLEKGAHPGQEQMHALMLYTHEYAHAIIHSQPSVEFTPFPPSNARLNSLYSMDEGFTQVMTEDIVRAAFPKAKWNFASHPYADLHNSVRDAIERSGRSKGEWLQMIRSDWKAAYAEMLDHS